MGTITDTQAETSKKAKLAEQEALKQFKNFGNALDTLLDLKPRSRFVVDFGKDGMELQERPPKDQVQPGCNVISLLNRKDRTQHKKLIQPVIELKAYLNVNAPQLEQEMEVLRFFTRPDSECIELMADLAVNAKALSALGKKLQNDKDPNVQAAGKDLATGSGTCNPVSQVLGRIQLSAQEAAKQYKKAGDHEKAAEWTALANHLNITGSRVDAMINQLQASKEIRGYGKKKRGWLRKVLGWVSGSWKETKQKPKE